MKLFGINSNEENCCKEVEEKEKKKLKCACNGDLELSETVSCCGNGDATCCDQNITSIKVLGAGCKSCHQQYENVKEALKEMNLEIEVEYITDMEKVMNYGVMGVPAIVVNEIVISMGKVLKSADVIEFLKNFK